MFCWQVAQPLTYFSVHFLSPGHQKCLSNRLMVRSRPGCPLVGVSWFLRRICLFKDSSGGITIFPSLKYVPESSWVTSFDRFQSSISERWRSWASVISWSSRSQGTSVVLTKICAGRSVRSALSFSPLSSEGGLDNISAAAWSFPGTCLIWRL